MRTGLEAMGKPFFQWAVWEGSLPRPRGKTCFLGPSLMGCPSARLTVCAPSPIHSNKDSKPQMPDFITRFMLKKPSGWKFTELCFLKDDSTFPLAFGEGDAELNVSQHLGTLLSLPLMSWKPWFFRACQGPLIRKHCLRSASLRGNLAVPGAHL